MATRVGIELSPGACRIIEIDDGVTRSSDNVPATRVRSYAVLEPGSAEMIARLATLRRRRAAVVVWGIKSDHRQVIVEQNGYDKMRAEALPSARQAAVETDGMLSDIAPAGRAQPGITRRPVLLAMGASRGIAAALRPLQQAGLRLRSVVTPADALASLARTRYAFSPEGTIEAFVALEETATAVALVRDGGLIAARELPWGFLADETGGRESRPREDIAARTADALSEFFAEIGSEPGSVRQISICGGMPELRSMTVQLMERLDVEVETLDSLFSIDSDHLPAPEQDFRDRSAELRLAWAVAADWVAPINLIRHRDRDHRRRMIARAAVIAGVAAGLGLGWRIQGSKWWQTTEPMIARATPPRATTTATKTVARLEEPRPPLGATAPAPPTAIASAESVRGGALAQPPPGAAKTVAAPAVPTPQTNAPPPLSAAAVPPAPLPPKITPPSAAVVPLALPPPKIAPHPAAPPVLPPAAKPPGPAPAPAVPAAATAPATSSSPRANTPATLPLKVAPPAAAKATSGTGSSSAPTPEANASGRTNAAVAPPPSVPPKVTLPPTAAPTTTPTITSAKPVVVGTPVPSGAVPAASSARANPSPAPRLVPPAAPVVGPPPRATESVSRPPEAAARVPSSAALPRQEPPAVRAAGRQRAASPPPLPLDALLGTILYSPERKLAIVDGRIVSVGDEVKGATIVDITPSSVLLRDGHGRMRSLTLGGSGR